MLAALLDGLLGGVRSEEGARSMPPPHPPFAAVPAPRELPAPLLPLFDEGPMRPTCRSMLFSELPRRLQPSSVHGFSVVERKSSTLKRSWDATALGAFIEFRISSAASVDALVSKGFRMASSVLISVNRSTPLVLDMSQVNNVGQNKHSAVPVWEPVASGLDRKKNYTLRFELGSKKGETFSLVALRFIRQTPTRDVLRA